MKKFTITQNDRQYKAAIEIDLNAVHDWTTRPEKNALGMCLHIEIAFNRGATASALATLGNLIEGEITAEVEICEGIVVIRIDDVDDIVWEEEGEE